MRTDNNIQNMEITPLEQEAARHCVKFAVENGAAQARVSFGKNTLDTMLFFNGTLDKVTHCADRSIFLNLFVDGKYGGYSTNRLDKNELEKFILKAIESTRMLAPDECRCLPEPERYAKNALTGKEMGLCDPDYALRTADEKLKIAASGAGFASFPKDPRYEIISEECEYSDSIDDSYIVDSQGFEGRHTETSHAFWTEITIADTKGRKYSGYAWSSAPFFKDLNVKGCADEALQKVVAQLNPKSVKGGKYTMVVDNSSSSRLVAPLLGALSAMAIQQNNSFLTSSIGKKIFSENLNIKDFALEKGKSGARLFDSEGVATHEMDIISGGVVVTYFVNTYMSKKMGIEPTIENASRPMIMPFIDTAKDKEGKDCGCAIDNTSKVNTGCNCAEGINNSIKSDNVGINIDQQTIMEHCGDGILVTGFNGGNCNPTTGYFSYGVEGFAFRNGKITHPVKEMLVTGDMISLWNSLVAAGNDARTGTRWVIPTLAFHSVDFSA